MQAASSGEQPDLLVFEDEATDSEPIKKMKNVVTPKIAYDQMHIKTETVLDELNDTDICYDDSYGEEVSRSYSQEFPSNRSDLRVGDEGDSPVKFSDEPINLEVNS